MDSSSSAELAGCGRVPDPPAASRRVAESPQNQTLGAIWFLERHVMLRHTFATRLPENRYDTRAVQQLRGHESVETTMIYMHVMAKSGLGTRCPLDG